jgi:hypothetical protein
LYFPTAPGATKQVRFTWNGGNTTATMAFNQKELFTDSLLPTSSLVVHEFCPT